MKSHHCRTVTVQNGPVFKGERLVIPVSMKDDMLAKMHASNTGIQGYLRKAQEVV